MRSALPTTNAAAAALFAITTITPTTTATTYSINFALLPRQALS